MNFAAPAASLNLEPLAQGSSAAVPSGVSQVGGLTEYFPKYGIMYPKL